MERIGLVYMLWTGGNFGGGCNALPLPLTIRITGAEDRAARRRPTMTTTFAAQSNPAPSFPVCDRIGRLSPPDGLPPFHFFLPLTCRLLGSALRHECLEFCSLYDGLDLQDPGSTLHFVRFLLGRLQSGDLRGEYLAE